MNGTMLSNVYAVQLLDEADEVITTHPHGAYLWPNGYLTVYPTTNQNEGFIYPPWKVSRIVFGKRKEVE